MATATADIGISEADLAAANGLLGNIDWNVEADDEENDGGDDEDDDGEEDYGGEDGVEEDEEDNDDIARRLNEQLWADISRAQADAQTQPASSTLLQKHASVLATVQTILGYLKTDPQAQQVFASTVIPGPLCEGATILQMFDRIIANKSVPKGVAKTFSTALLAVASSELLFGGLPHTSALGMSDMKRKREDGVDDEFNGAKRTRTNEFQHPVSSAVSSISSTLASAFAGSGSAVDSTTVAALQLPLHQVFLFAVTSAPRATSSSSTLTLQEVGALIQVLGVLSGIKIGHAPTSTSSTSASILDIGTAVYPCTAPSGTETCSKVFTRLYSLRLHERSHSSGSSTNAAADNDPRPFKCAQCQTSFARNHDLKRHARLHDRRAWRCAGCSKIFSRRDAIKRHKNAATRTPGSACVEAPVEEVEIGDEDGGEDGKEVRRTKMWNANGPVTSGWPLNALEDGEIALDDVRRLQDEVLSLHELLRSCVLRSLGAPDGTVLRLSASAFSSAATDTDQGLETLVKVLTEASANGSDPPKDGQALLTSGHDPLTSTQSQPQTVDTSGSASEPAAGAAPLSSYGLSEEQTRLLEAAIAHAASAAQAQAEAEALEDEDGEGEWAEDVEGEDAGADVDVAATDYGGEDGAGGNNNGAQDGVASIADGVAIEDEDEDAEGEDDDDMVEEDIPPSAS